MKSYWDSSALIEAALSDSVRLLLEEERGCTRPHAFSECFSILTGGRLGHRFPAKEVATLLEEISDHLEIIDLSIEQQLEVFKEARARGVRGGGIYDLMHAASAHVHDCEKLYTLNLSDFESLYDELIILEPGD